MKKIQLLTFILTSVFLISACSQAATTEEIPAFAPQYDWPIAPFEAVNQEGSKRSLSDFEGEVWIMNMIFTNCETVCLPMTANMAKLQQKVNEENLIVRLVSFSVDPLIDTPDLLKDYAMKYEADFSNWDLLTGYSEDDIKRIAKSVKTLAEKPEDTDQVTHSTKFFLINKEGVAVKGYNGTNIPLEEIISDLKSFQ